MKADNFHKWRNYLLFAVMCLIWSTTWSILKLGLEETPPMLGLACRFTVAGIFLFFIIFIKRIPIIHSPSHLRLYLIVGLFNMCLSYFFTYWGTQYIASGLSSIIWATFPLMIGLGSYFFLPSEQLNISRIAAIGLSVLGVIFIFSDETLLNGRNTVLGASIVLCGVLVAAFPNVYVKKFQKNYEPLVLTGVSVAIAAVLHFIGAYIFGEFPEMTWDLKNISIFAYLGIFGTAITFLIYYDLLKRIRVTKLSFVTFIPPIFAVLIGALFLEETVTIKEISGMLLIFWGVFLYDWKKYQPFLIRNGLIIKMLYHLKNR